MYIALSSLDYILFNVACLAAGLPMQPTDNLFEL